MNFLKSIFRNEEEKTCPVCYGLLDENVVETPCKHLICSDCFFKCETPTCPLCRRKFWETPVEVQTQFVTMPSRTPYSELREKESSTLRSYKMWKRYSEFYHVRATRELEKYNEAYEKVKQYR